MSQRPRFIALFVALILTCGPVTPSTATGVAQSSAAPTPVVAAPTTSGPAEAHVRTRKRGGNRFVRVLTAPFRALAKLFSGERERSDDAAARAKKQSGEPTAAAAAAAPQADAQAGVATGERPQVPPGRVDVKKAGGAAESGANVAGFGDERGPKMPTPTSPARPGANIIRPDERGARPAAPATWVPFIESIPKDHLSQGRALLKNGYLSEAIAELSVASTVGPDLIEANNLLGLAYDKLGWYGQAATAYERALALAPNDPQVLNNLGFSLYLNSNFDGALKRLKQAARYAPGAPAVLGNLGLVQARLGRYDEAFKNFVRAGGEYDARLRIAQLLESGGRAPDAIRHYEAALRIQPGASAVLEHLAELYERTGRQKQAEAARRTLANPPNKQRTATGGGG